MEKYKIIDASDWKTSMYSKGSKEKIDVINSQGKKYMLKYPAENSGDNWSEKIASELGKELGFNVQNVELGMYQGRQSALIEYSLLENEQLIEGYSIIKLEIKDFNNRKLIGYNFQNIIKIFKKIKSIKKYKTDEQLLEKFIEILIFDILIGNTDRHCENWGIISNLDYEIKLAVAYDNSSSLGREFHSNKDKVTTLLSEATALQRYIKRASSLIGWKEKEQPTHFEFLKELVKEEDYDFSKYIPIFEGLTLDIIKNIVEKIPAEFMTDDSKKLTIEIINIRKEIIIDILKGSE